MIKRTELLCSTGDVQWEIRTFANDDPMNIIYVELWSYCVNLSVLYDYQTPVPTSACSRPPEIHRSICASSWSRCPMDPIQSVPLFIADPDGTMDNATSPRSGALRRSDSSPARTLSQRHRHSTRSRSTFADFVSLRRARYLRVLHIV